MPGYNKNFELSVSDAEIIESALREKKRELSDQTFKDDHPDRSGVVICHDTAEQVRSIHDLLGRIHNQKVFFRPSGETYIGG
jgi:divalent metal cation (Fe/Co/Zn/Cd) transporter